MITFYHLFHLLCYHYERSVVIDGRCLCVCVCVCVFLQNAQGWLYAPEQIEVSSDASGPCAQVQILKSPVYGKLM